MNCKVKSLVYYEHQRNEFVVEHSHQCFECVFYFEGSGNISVEKDSYSYDGPTLTVVSPGLLHDEIVSQKSKLYIILFDTDEPEAFKPFNLFKIDEKDSEMLKSVFAEMNDEEKNKQLYYQDMISSMFTAIICKYARGLSSIKASSNKEMVERTKTYIKENYRQNINFEKIAYNVGYSFDRFRHIFKAETGVSIHQYLLNCRLYAAKQLLLTSNITIKEVSYSCGFDSVVHFNNFFKSKMGISPFQFRKASMIPIDKGVFAFENTQRKQLIIDTDIGGDCDDAGALALANIFHNSGNIKILGMTFTTSCKYGPACMDAINKYYGNSFEIGQTVRKNYCEFANCFQEVLAKEFPNDIYDQKNQTLKPVINSIELLRKKLASANDNSVSIVCIGQLNNASDLLDSDGDQYSPLSGVELVKKKVKEFIVMGGMFPKDNKPVLFEGSEYKSEYNIVSDITSSKNFLNKCPCQIYFVDFLCGYEIKTGGSLLSQNNDKNPVTIAYKLFQNKPRQSWDLLTVWFATFGKDDFFSISQEGKISIDNNGVTTHNADIKAGHYYLSLNNSIDNIVKKIDSVLVKEN